MHNRVVRVLPALVLQPAWRAALVLDEPIAVAVPVLVNPSQRAIQRRSERAQRLEISGPLVVVGRANQEQRRGVNRPVVGRVRDHPRLGELADAKLVQDLSRLSISPGVVVSCLQPGEHAQRVEGQLRGKQHRLTRGHKSVSTKCRDVPRNSRRDEPPTRGGRDQCPQIAHRSADKAVEQLTVTPDLSARCEPIGTRMLQIRGRRLASPSPTAAPPDRRFDAHQDLDGFAGLERHLPAPTRLARSQVQVIRCRRELDDRLPEDLVLADVREHQPACSPLRRHRVPPRGPAHPAANLEHVREVGGNSQRRGA